METETVKDPSIVVEDTEFTPVILKPELAGKIISKLSLGNKVSVAAKEKLNV
ncbi:MAG: hypothetical protein ACE5HS_00985 [bacterium]